MSASHPPPPPPPIRQKRKKKRLESVWILTQGSRGDVQPYIPVAVALQKRGVRVRFYTNADFVDFAAGFLGPDDASAVVSCGISVEAEFRSNPRLARAIADGNLFALARQLVKNARENAPKVADLFASEIDEDRRGLNHLPDLCIITPLIRYVGYHLALNHGVPFIEVSCQAIAYDPNSMIFGMPTLPFGLHYYLLRLFIGGSHAMIEPFDEHWNSNILARFSKRQFLRSLLDPDLPIVVLMPPELARVAYPSNISSMYRFVGASVITSEQQQQKKADDGRTTKDFGGGDGDMEKLRAFLDDEGGGDPDDNDHRPVYLGFGSMVSKSKEFMTEWCVRALRRARKRGVVLGGWAGLSCEVLEGLPGLEPELLEYARNSVIFVKTAPHEWLFPKVAAVVHHGGAGTTAAGLRAGVPTVITPVFGDQYDNSRLVCDLGVGVGFSQPLQRVTWQELGEAISTVVGDARTVERAAALGARLRDDSQNNNGAENAVNELEKYWDEYCVTGRFFELFPGDNNEAEDGLARKRKAVTTATAVVAVAAAAAGAFWILRKKRV